MKKFRLLIIGVFTFALTSCGGGGGGSTAGAGGTIFTGVAITTFSRTGFLDQIINIGVTFSVTATTITVSDSESNSGTAAINANGVNFAVPLNVQGSVSKDSFSCQGGSIIFTGTINGANISGTLSGVLPCLAGSQTVTFNISGTFSASQ